VADLQRIEDLRRRVQRDPASIAFAQLAEELRRAHEFEESVATCRAGLEIHPEYLSARVTLGRALVELNQLDAAQDELARVLKSAPENLAAIRGLGDIHYRRGDLQAALAQYRTALALARNDPDLEEIVERLAKDVEPQKPAIPADGLTFDEMHAELLAFAPPPRPAPPAAPAAEVAPPPPPGPLAATAAQGAPPPRPAASAAAVASELIPEPASSAGAPSTREPAPEDPARVRASRTVAALEEWLEAVNVARTDRVS